MAEFTYSDYLKKVESRNKSNNNSNQNTIGFFKLANDGDEALVRFNCESVEDLRFATTHTVKEVDHWRTVYCIRDNSANGTVCPLCEEAKKEGSPIARARDVVYISLLASHKDKATGTYLPAVPEIWSVSASMSRNISTKLNEVKNLKKQLCKVVRHGAHGDIKTTYSIDYALSNIYPDSMIPEDFSAFDGYDTMRSIHTKSAEDMRHFLSTGSFPVINPTANAEPQQANTFATQARQTVAQAQTQDIPAPSFTEPVRQEAPSIPTPPKTTSYTFGGATPASQEAPQAANIPTPPQTNAPEANGQQESGAFTRPTRSWDFSAGGNMHF